MDNAAGDDPNAGIPGGVPPQDDNLGGAAPGDAGDDGENVDQFYDDGGETFLPADHVSISSKTVMLSNASMCVCLAVPILNQRRNKDSIWLRIEEMPSAHVCNWLLRIWHGDEFSLANILIVDADLDSLFYDSHWWPVCKMLWPSNSRTSMSA